MLKRPRKEKKHNSEGNPSREYVTKTFCDERFQRVVDKLESIDKKIDGFISEKKEESHALRNAIITLTVGALLALLGYGLGRLPH